MYSTDAPITARPVIKLLKTMLTGLCLNWISPYGLALSFTLHILPVSLAVVNAAWSIIAELDTSSITEQSTSVTILTSIFLALVKYVNLALNRTRTDHIFKSISVDLPKHCNAEQRGILAKASRRSYVVVLIIYVGLTTFQVIFEGSGALFQPGGVNLPVAILGGVVPGASVGAFVANLVFQIWVSISCNFASVVSDGILVLSMLHLESGLEVLLDKIDRIRLSERNPVSDQLRDVYQYQLLLMGFEIHCDERTCSHQQTKSAYTMISLLVPTALVEIFTLCYVGQQIQNKSESVAGRLYSLPWLRLELADRRRLVTMTTVSGRPLTISTPFVDLTHATFGQVLKTAYTVYAFLHKVSQSN